ncbi:helix-turn-helix domain-containing protein [Gordoniibacillus kamchatkensis]|nr:helix-turn-helix transcriptional regulator [Paenibacillus sp. VKM B-2647]
MERGTRNISIESLEKIMEALGIEPSDLFDFKTIKIEDTESEIDQVIYEH